VSEDEGILKLAAHELDDLIYRILLQGNFQVECNVTTGHGGNSSVLVAGRGCEVIDGGKAFRPGGFQKDATTVQMSPSLSPIAPWPRYRALVKDGVIMMSINGRRLISQQLPEHQSLWISLRSWRHPARRQRIFGLCARPSFPKKFT
jgi:hypothetical protein